MSPEALAEVAIVPLCIFCSLSLAGSFRLNGGVRLLEEINCAGKNVGQL